MQMIRMLNDWMLAEDESTSHWLTAGNTFVVDDDAAARAVDDDGAAEYVGTRPSKKSAPAAVEGEPVVSTDAAGTAPTGDATSAAAATSLAAAAVVGESAPNTLLPKGKTAKAGEDAPA